MTAADATPRNRAPEDREIVGTGFLEVLDRTSGAQRLFDQDVAEYGFVMNGTKMWARQPDTYSGLFEVMQRNIDQHGLDVRQRAILTVASTSTLGDAYCSLGWGGKLAEMVDADTAAGVVCGDDSGLTSAERAMARWARKITADPNCTSRGDVQELRDAGFSESQIFGITVFVALRIAFATVNDALGACPDEELRCACPEAVVNAVTFGRPIVDSTN